MRLRSRPPMLLLSLTGGSLPRLFTHTTSSCSVPILLHGGQGRVEHVQLQRSQWWVVGVIVRAFIRASSAVSSLAVLCMGGTHSFNSAFPPHRYIAGRIWPSQACTLTHTTRHDCIHAGVPTCASNFLLNITARTRYGADIFVMSDYGAVGE